MSFKTINNSRKSVFRDKGSKFLGFAIPVTDTEQIEKELKSLRSVYPDATHHCFAYRTQPDNLSEFSNDDGEPSGTAGLPILNKLRSLNIVNVIVIVVRYYGGTNLGKSGLIKAYATATDLLFEDVQLIELHCFKDYKIRLPYEQTKFINNLMNMYSGTVVNSKYTTEVELEVKIPEISSTTFEENLQNVEWLQIYYESGKKYFAAMGAK